MITQQKKAQKKNQVLNNQMSNDEFEKKNSIKDCSVERQPWKNNKIKYLIMKQFKTQTMQTKHGIKNERK